jgi:hypothetical protein
MDKNLLFESGLSKKFQLCAVVECIPIGNGAGNETAIIIR